MKENRTIELIIPTYKPGPEFSETLRRLALQTVKPDRLTVINTGEEFWDPAFEEAYPGLFVTHIQKSEFNHGTTRFKAAAASSAGILIFMTQDALPKTDRMIEHLIQPVLCERAAVSYARQLPKEDADPIEEITRVFNYPDQSRIKTTEDLKTLGIKTYFCSNVCAAYDKDVYDELGGFPHPVEFNEDMIFAAKVIAAGYSISYTAEAKVLHSHNYSAREQYERNYLVGRTQALYPEIFEKVPSEKEGMGLVKKTAFTLMKRGRFLYVFKLAWISAFKYLGYRAGKRSVQKNTK